jgi:preprotein translocase subunit YajC
MNQNAAFMQFVPLIIIMGIFYFLLIRPQQKQASERKNMLAALKPGDKVLTNGGLIGLIDAVAGDELQMEIAKNVKVTVVRSGVAGLLSEPVKK